MSRSSFVVSRVLSRALGAAVLALSAFTALPALADAPPPRADLAERAAPRRYVQRNVEVAAGVRTVVVRGQGYDPYASNDVLPALSLGVRAMVLKARPLSLSLLGGYEVGAEAETARGLDTHLVAHRILLGAEGRLDLGQRLALFARATPGVLHTRGSITDPGVPELVSRNWTWSLDATGGLALLVGRVGDPEWPAVRFWLTAEMGYAFAGEVAMTYTPDAPDDDPRRYGSVDLPPLRLSGMVNRFTFAVSF